MRPIPKAGLVLIAAAFASGCSEELGPVPMPVARVRGVMREGSRPVGGGWIEFTPVDGTIGKLRSARLRADGKFEADGVAVGINQVRIVNATIGGSPYRGIFSASMSPIRREIAPDGTGAIEIDLITEAVRFQQRLERSGVGPSRGGQP